MCPCLHVCMGTWGLPLSPRTLGTHPSFLPSEDGQAFFFCLDFHTTPEFMNIIVSSQPRAHSTVLLLNVVRNTDRKIVKYFGNTSCLTGALSC